MSDNRTADKEKLLEAISRLLKLLSAESLRNVYILLLHMVPPRRKAGRRPAKKAQVDVLVEVPVDVPEKTLNRLRGMKRFSGMSDEEIIKAVLSAGLNEDKPGWIE